MHFLIQINSTQYKLNWKKNWAFFQQISTIFCTFFFEFSYKLVHCVVESWILNDGGCVWILYGRILQRERIIIFSSGLTLGESAGMNGGGGGLKIRRKRLILHNGCCLILYAFWRRMESWSIRIHSERLKIGKSGNLVTQFTVISKIVWPIF